MIKDGLWDAFHGYHMSVTAENVAEKFQITRQEQDKFALKSQDKALMAVKIKDKEEIIDFKIKSKNQKSFLIKMNILERYQSSALSRLKPVFKKDGMLHLNTALTMGLQRTMSSKEAESEKSKNWLQLNHGLAAE